MKKESDKFYGPYDDYATNVYRKNRQKVTQHRFGIRMSPDQFQKSIKEAWLAGFHFYRGFPRNEGEE